MKMIVVSVMDTAVGAFMRPFVAPSRGAALRSFVDEVNRAGSEMEKHPGDYHLYYLGEWDDGDGSFECKDGKSILCRGVDALKGEK